MRSLPASSRLKPRSSEEPSPNMGFISMEESMQSIDPASATTDSWGSSSISTNCMTSPWMENSASCCGIIKAGAYRRAPFRDNGSRIVSPRPGGQAANPASGRKNPIGLFRHMSELDRQPSPGPQQAGAWGIVRSLFLAEAGRLGRGLAYPGSGPCPARLRRPFLRDPTSAARRSGPKHARCAPAAGTAMARVPELSSATERPGRGRRSASVPGKRGYSTASASSSTPGDSAWRAGTRPVRGRRGSWRLAPSGAAPSR